MPARLLLIALLLLHPLTGAVSAITASPTQSTETQHQSCCALCTCDSSCACSAQDPADSPSPKPAPITASAKPTLHAPQSDDYATAPYSAHPLPRLTPTTQSPEPATSSIEAARRLCVWRT